MTLSAFRVCTKNVIYEYKPVGNGNSYYVKGTVDGKEQPLNIITKEEAQMTYDYCSSMWIDFDVEAI